MFHCPVGVWVIEQHAKILSATVRSPTVNKAVMRPSYLFTGIFYTTKFASLYWNSPSGVCERDLPENIRIFQPKMMRR